MFADISTVVFGLVGGIAAWLGVNFVGRPILRFTDLRRDIRKSMFALEQLEPVWESESNPARASQIVAYQNRLGALRQQIAAHSNEIAAIRDSDTIGAWLLGRWYDLSTAAKELRHFSTANDWDNVRLKHRQKVDAALRFRP